MGTATWASARPSFDDRTILSLAVLDLAVLSALIVYGQSHHSENLLAGPASALQTVAPFALGWIVASLLAGVYVREVARSPARTVRVTSVAWIAAANLGLILRTSPVFDSTAVWPFNLVITGTGLVALVCVHLGFAALVDTDS